jgi:hypothetical protein
LEGGLQHDPAAFITGVFGPSGLCSTVHPLKPMTTLKVTGPKTRGRSPRYGLKIAPKTFAENVFLETGRREVRELSEIPGLYGFHNLQMFNPLLEEHILRRNS